MGLESRDDLGSILPYLPVILRSSAVSLPLSVVEALKSLSMGPTHSNVTSGKLFALAIDDLRNSLGLCSLHSSASLGFSLFFDDLINKDEADNWFQHVLPQLADLLLRLPALLDSHYQNVGAFNGMTTALRLLKSQQTGIVFLTQANGSCCLVFFRCLYEYYELNQENKIKCIVHYFKKICSNMPTGNVSFERKVLHLKNSPFIIYPEAHFWSKSMATLCQLEVCTSGLIEDHSSEALEVDFANKYIGGGALSRGCVQEEIRFMINPELIVSTLFLPSMADNEAIEIVGAERFSNYTGYAKSFRFSGDYVDKKSVDTMGRRMTRIVAIDALCSPGKRQYRLECLVRESNKAFCGFLDQHSDIFAINDPSIPSQTAEEAICKLEQNVEGQVHEIGVATGNWGCGAFGGDPEVKVVIQWLAGSQSRRPFILYYTFNLEPLQKLKPVVQWILSQEWTVGELWNILVEYSTRRLRGETTVGFFKWLVPSLYDDDDDGDDPMTF